MARVESRRNGTLLAPARLVGVAAVTMAFLASSGCAARTLTIVQAGLINDEAKSTGEPLEVTIVCVTPEDLKKERNELLDPTSDITCKQWYAFRPDKNSRDATRFQIPSNQIFLLTDQPKGQVWGQIRGPALRGADRDSRGGKVVVKNIAFPRDLWNKKSVIYVFPRFIGKDWNELPVAPVKYNPPGDSTRKLSCEIGTRATGQGHRQYIDRK